MNPLTKRRVIESIYLSQKTGNRIHMWLYAENLKQILEVVGITNAHISLNKNQTWDVKGVYKGSKYNLCFWVDTGEEPEGYLKDREDDKKNKPW